jgi:hypothetical protein
MDFFLDVSGCGAAFYTKNNCFKVQFDSASVPPHLNHKLRMPKSYGVRLVTHVVEIRGALHKPQLARDSRMLPQSSGGNMTPKTYTEIF